MCVDLDAIPGWVKVRVFDALVKEFSGKEQFSHMQRVLVVPQNDDGTKAETCMHATLSLKIYPATR